jgi:predicted acylesterase/phospholipase RssA
MAGKAQSALVLQGGGALGAYEYGAARALYELIPNFKPDLIAGVSIGAITAALLARPKPPLDPLKALEAFWDRVTVNAPFVPPAFRPYEAFFGNRNFFVPRSDYWNWLSWTDFYDTAPLLATLKELVSVDGLADTSRHPELLVSATNVEKGEVTYFSSDQGLTLDHIMASGSLPPAFPMTRVQIGHEEQSFWDGGLFDNTPLGEVLRHMANPPHPDQTIYVINLFPSKALVPTSLPQVLARMKTLQFANKTAEDLKLLCRFNDVAELMRMLEEKLGPEHAVLNDPAYLKLKGAYVTVPNIVSVTPRDLFEEFDDADFSPAAIAHRKRKGYEETKTALQKPASWRNVCKTLNT